MRGAVAGIDGGGTKTRCLIADRTGRILGEGFGGPSNYHAAGIETATESLRTAVGSALAAVPGARLIDSVATPAEGAVAIALAAVNEGGNAG